MTNWRDIYLLSLDAKLYNRMVLNRFRTPIYTILKKKLAGFRTGRSYIPQIHILRRIMNGAYSEKISLFIPFVDFKKAFDSIDRAMLFAILRQLWHPCQNCLSDWYRVLYNQSTCQVYLRGQLSALQSQRPCIDTALLESDSIQAQRQQDLLKIEAGKIGLEISVQKNEPLRLNKPANLSTVDQLDIIWFQETRCASSHWTCMGCIFKT